MEFIRENKGVIIFYLMLAIFTFVLVENAKVNTGIINNYVITER